MVKVIRDNPKQTFMELLDSVGAAPLARFPKFVAQLKGAFDRGRLFPPGAKPSIVLLIGESGTGKSWYAREHYPNAYRWSLGNGGNSLWMEAYDGQEECVIDDYSGQIPFRTLLNLIDFHPYCMQNKGGSCQVHVKTWIISSNLEPEDWYPGERIAQHYEPLSRRLKEWGSRPDYISEFKKWRRAQPIMPPAAAAAAAPPALSLGVAVQGDMAQVAFVPHPPPLLAYNGQPDYE